MGPLSLDNSPSKYSLRPFQNNDVIILMACQLVKDPSGTVDFTTNQDAAITVVIHSSSATVRIVAATLNGTPLILVAGKAVFTAVAGRNNLDLALAGSNPSEDFEIREDCGSGSTCLMAKGNIQSGPTRGFRIHAF